MPLEQAVESLHVSGLSPGKEVRCRVDVVHRLGALVSHVSGNAANDTPNAPQNDIRRIGQRPPVIRETFGCAAARVWWNVRAVLVGLLLAISASHVGAAGFRITVHVADHAGIPANDFDAARHRVQAVYRAAGIVLDFASAQRKPGFDDAHHVELVIFSDAMVALEMRSGHVTSQVVGRASRPLRRAYIYYGHVVSHARDTRSSPALVLAMTIAHEVAHLHLPPGSHSSSGGIMDARVSGRISRLPAFTDAQAAAIRDFLTRVQQPPGPGIRLAQAQLPPAGVTATGSEDLVVMAVDRPRPEWVD